MSEILSEASEFAADIIVPSPGDPRTADSVKTPFQALTNRTRWLIDRIAGRSPQRYLYCFVTANTAITATQAPLQWSSDSVQIGENEGIMHAAGDRFQAPVSGKYKIRVGVTRTAGDTFIVKLQSSTNGTDWNDLNATILYTANYDKVNGLNVNNGALIEYCGSFDAEVQIRVLAQSGLAGATLGPRFAEIALL